MEIYSIENLTFTYPDATHETLSGVSLQIEEGDFVLLCGRSGSGKSTLLSMLKKEITPKGKKSGNITFKGINLNHVDNKLSVQSIGYCMQNPDTQQVFDSVKKELRFVLENLNIPDETIDLKVAETVSFFSIENLYNKKFCELSGGEKQIINIAASIVSEPDVLLLDEPFSQLDTFSCERLLSLLKKINDELGITIVIAEHNLTNILTVANRIFYLENGRVDEVSQDTLLEKEGISVLPAIVLQKLNLKNINPIPITIARARQILQKYSISCTDQKYDFSNDQKILELKKLWFRYEKNSPDVLKGLSLDVHQGEILSVIGCNGSGKSTLASIISNSKKAYSGQIKIDKNIKISVLPQNPKQLFRFDTVIQILRNTEKQFGYRELFHELNAITPDCNCFLSERIKAVAERLDIISLLSCNPFDLSVGQQQLVAFANVLMEDADIIILDEPTKGIDIEHKTKILEIMEYLKDHHKTIIHITHDLNFAAEVSDRCALLFDGKIVTCNDIHSFMCESRNYTSDVAKIFANTPKENRPVSLKEVEKCKIVRKLI